MATGARIRSGELALKVLAAAGPEDIFPSDDDAARAEYRRLARILHPDLADTDTTEAFRRLSDLYEWHRTGMEPSSVRRITMSTKTKVYILGDLAYNGDIANLYRATYDDGGDPATALMKIPRGPKDSDLLETEARALKGLIKEIDEQWLPFFPTLIETFRHQDAATKERRRVNVIKYFDGFVSLADVMKAYPQGLDPRDVAWMWRRLLVALGVTHDAGYVHGAPTPENILIHPEQHGLVLIDWCYSVREGESLKAIPEKRRNLYPEYDIADKRPITGALDMYVAHQTIGALFNKATMSGQYRAFLSGVMQPKPMGRPEAGETLKALEDLLRRLYGPRRFRPFEMPAV